MPGGRPSPLTDDLARESFHTDEGLHAAAARLQTAHKTLKGAWIRLFGQDAYDARVQRIRKLTKAGENNPSYTGRPIRANGYLRQPPPDWWTGPVNGLKSPGSKGWVYQHQVIAAREAGLTRIPEGHHVHHVDNNGENNHPSNLRILTVREHRALHRRLAQGYVS